MISIMLNEKKLYRLAQRKELTINRTKTKIFLEGF